MTMTMTTRMTRRMVCRTQVRARVCNLVGNMCRHSDFFYAPLQVSPFQLLLSFSAAFRHAFRSLARIDLGIRAFAPAIPLAFARLPPPN
eukprot:2342183-Rhodomonas_salina.1